MLVRDCRIAIFAYHEGMIERLRVFLVALEEGSLNRAAIRLRMSQSALTRQMQALEAEVGGLLMERGASGIRPTGAGHALAAAMMPVIADYDRAMAEARRLARGQRDLIRVGYLGSASQTFLDPALAALRREHTEVKVKLLDLSPGEQVAALRKGEIDLALVGQEGASVANEFYTRKLASIPLIAVLPAGHPLAGKQSLLLGDLKNERFVASPEEDLPGRDRWITQLCKKAGFRPRFDGEADCLSQMFTLVSSEGLVAVVPGYLKTFRTAGVAMIAISDASALWDFLVVWQRGKMPGGVLALLEFLSTAARSACEREKQTGE